MDILNNGTYQASVNDTSFEKEDAYRGFCHRGTKYVHYTSRKKSDSAFFRFSLLQKVLMTLFFLCIVTGFIVNWHRTILIFIIAFSFFYFIDLLFNLLLVLFSVLKRQQLVIHKDDIMQLQDESLPTYTVLCPLYKEWTVLTQFTRAMSNLDYPKDKLQVMLLLEEDDRETISKINNMQLPSYFTIHVVPQSLPKTKPKALNWGILHQKSDYIVIYDAEDIPDKDQLKKAVIAFRKLPPDIFCVQAKLNFYNPYQNILTHLFAAEYSLWFDIILPGLQGINAPIPLGGTSNHFKTKYIHRLEGWDAFNVTEDADIGLRIAKEGYKTAIIDSTTLEEANSSLSNWIKQRSRWIKGYIQTYFVYMRNPWNKKEKWKQHQVIQTQFIVGGKVLSLLINPLMWIMTILYFSLHAESNHFIRSFFPSYIFYISILSLAIGNFIYLYNYLIGIVLRKQWRLAYIIFFVPFYWLLISLAALLAIWEFIFRPYHWNKTKHGLHLKANNAFAV